MKKRKLAREFKCEAVKLNSWARFLRVPKLKPRLGRCTKLDGWWVMKKWKLAREFKFEAAKLNTDRDVKTAQASQDLGVQPRVT